MNYLEEQYISSGSISSGSTSSECSVLQDPIIKRMLSERSVDLNDAIEIERLNRMTAMLRNSKKYKRSLLREVNHSWSSSVGSLSDTSSHDIFKPEKPKRVRFSDTATVIAPPSVPSDLSFVQKLKKFLRK